MLEHGGKLRQAADQYGIALGAWVDLSTGINPNGWPVPPVPTDCWTRLPENEDELTASAKRYYDCQSLLSVAGSQAAIQMLSKLKTRLTVGIVTPSYNEHAHSWSTAGHHVTTFPEENIEAHIDDIDVLILVNPNNPTGYLHKKNKLLRWLNQLQAKNGWLIIDEAFMDCENKQSLANQCPQTGLIILRSLGKFFGLAGARVGFVLAEQSVLSELEKRFGPWPIANPSRFIATLALSDFRWQKNNRQRLINEGLKLKILLKQNQLTPDGGCNLFQWIKHEQAELIHHQLATQGILCRLFSKPASLRFGLPANTTQWQRLEMALTRL